MCPVHMVLWLIMLIWSYTRDGWTRKSNILSIFIHAGRSRHTSDIANANGYSASAMFFPAIWSFLRWNDYTADTYYLLVVGKDRNNSPLNVDYSHTSFAHFLVRWWSRNDDAKILLFNNLIWLLLLRLRSHLFLHF